MTMSRIKEFEIFDPNFDFNLVGDDTVSGYSVEEISLEKKMLQPNELRFTLRRNKVERTQQTVQFSIASDILSKKVKCTVETSLKGLNQTNTGYRSVNFEGIIVSAAMEDLKIKCIALSKDYELSLIPHCNYFINKTLKEIVESIVPADITTYVTPSNTAKIPYVVQYNETDYDFLVRLAKRFGEFFYFDQTHGLVFGKIPDDDAVDLKRFDDFLTVQYELTSGNPNHSYVANHYQKEGILKSGLQDYGSGRDSVANLFAHSKTASTKVENDPNNITLYYDYPNLLSTENSKTTLNNAGELWSKSESASFVVCRCTTYRPDLYVGLIIRFYEPAGGVDYNNGLFMVTSTHLTLDCNGSPVNEITAIGGVVYGTDLLFIPPYVDVNAYPRSSAQRAIVVDNIDPLKMGRVRVRFAWQNVGKNFPAPADEDENKVFPWIRIAQPYGGDKKGCYILPEIGEEVMVGFEHDNMEKPFVIGTLFHDSTQANEKQMPDEPWLEDKENHTNGNNEVKAFRTKKGHTIEFHDVDGDQNFGFIRIYGNEKKDGPNYDIILSTDKIQEKNGDQKEDYKAKSADEEAETGKDIKEKADYQVGKLRIMVRSNGGDIMLDAGDGDIIMKAQNIRVNATGNTTSLIEGKNVVKVKGDQFIDVNNNSMVVQGKQNFVVKGEDTENYKGTVAIKSEKSVDIQVDEEVKMKAQKAINLDAKDSVEMQSKTLKVETLKDTALTVHGQYELNAIKDVKVSTQSGIGLTSSSKVEVKGASVNVQAQTNASLKGLQVAVESEAATSVKGGTILLDTQAGTRKGTWTDI